MMHYIKDKNEDTYSAIDGKGNVVQKLTFYSEKNIEKGIDGLTIDGILNVCVLWIKELNNRYNTDDRNVIELLKLARDKLKANVMHRLNESNNE